MRSPDERPLRTASERKVVHDRVVIGGRDKLLHAIDRATGEPRWSHDLIEEFGATPADVVRTKTYVIDMVDYLEHGVQAWIEFFAGNPPTSTTVGVTEFADPRALVEIEAYAEVD